MPRVRQARTNIDWALFLKDVARPYCQAEKSTLVMDNLDTHGPGSLYDTFPPVVAKALWHRFEFVYTPKHGSWLNIAEIEMNVLIRQCLNRWIDTLDEMRTATQAWKSQRDNAPSRINWQFTTNEARIKLMRLYPTLKA